MTRAAALVREVYAIQKHLQEAFPGRRFPLDGKLIGTRPFEYRTPRGAYIQLGADTGAEALIEYYAYDLSGAYQP